MEPNIIANPELNLPPEPKRSLPKLPLIFVGVILVATFMLGAYLLGQKSMKKTAANLPAQTTVKPTPITDPTANWKIYSNNKYFYSITYPTGWSIDTSNQTPEYLTIRLNTTYPQSPGDVEPIMYWVNLTYVQNSNSLTFKNLVTKDLPQNLKDNFTYSTEKINNLTAYRTTSLPSQLGCEWVYFPNPDNNYISVNFCLYDKTKPFIHQQENYDLFNKMLATFKFTTSASPTDETAKAPTSVVNDFYSAYVNCNRKYFDDLSKGSSTQKCPSLTSYPVLKADLVSELSAVKQADPILCAQNIPTSINVDQAITSGNTAITTVRTFYGSSDNPIKVSLEKQNNQWLISDITCKQ